MSMLEDYGAIRVERSVSYHSSSSGSGSGSRSFSDDESPQDGLIINVNPFDYDKGNAIIVIMRYLDITSAYSEVLQLQVCLSCCLTPDVNSM